MSSRHRFLQRSITHVSLHNRLTEEEAMWRRREQERGENNKQRYRSRSPYEKRSRSSRKHRSSSSTDNESQKKDNDIQIEGEFGPPLPSNLGINADRWDHALFMQRYPEEYDKQMTQSKGKESADNKEEKKKKKHSKHHRHRRLEEENKRKHRSKS